MPEVARCPMCGSSDITRQREAGDCRVETWIEYECFSCGDDAPTFRTLESWNRYAAAMELAIATAAYFTLATEAGHKRLQEAGQRVLELFTQKQP